MSAADCIAFAKSPRCRRGDLAMIIRSPGTPENIGKLVQIIDRWNGHDLIGEARFVAPSCPVICWVVNAAGTGLEFIQVTAGRKTGKSRLVRGVVQDDYLRPIRPGIEAADIPGTTEALV